MGRKTFNSKVAGVTKNNPDGKNRQGYIEACCKPGQELVLKRELDNPYDSHAIGVWVKFKPWFRAEKEFQIGYLNRQVAKEVAEHIDPGGKATARIKNITGGTEGKETLGVNIEVTLE